MSLDPATPPSDSERARELLLNDGDAAEWVGIFLVDDAGATPLFGVNVSVGWAEYIMGLGMYEHIARGVAYALASVLDCEVKA